MPLARHGFRPLRRLAATEATLFSEIDPELARDLGSALGAAGEKALAGACGCRKPDPSEAIAA